MKIIKKQSLALTFAMYICTILALPFKFLVQLFIVVIDLLINVPVMNEVWRERRELEMLSEEHIKDIDLDKIVVRHESKRSYFDIPPDRKRSCKRASRFSKLFWHSQESV